jgi:hypothetical protein
VLIFCALTAAAVATMHRSCAVLLCCAQTIPVFTAAAVVPNAPQLRSSSDVENQFLFFKQKSYII